MIQDLQLSTPSHTDSLLGIVLERLGCVVLSLLTPFGICCRVPLVLPMVLTTAAGSAVSSSEIQQPKTVVLGVWSSSARGPTVSLWLTGCVCLCDLMGSPDACSCLCMSSLQTTDTKTRLYRFAGLRFILPSGDARSIRHIDQQLCVRLQSDSVILHFKEEAALLCLQYTTTAARASHLLGALEVLHGCGIGECMSQATVC
jgi:hypothetical protein